MKVLFSCNGFIRSNLNKQPWKYIYENAKYLFNSGDEVVIITEGEASEGIIDGIRIIYVNKIFQVFLGETKDFVNIVHNEKPDKVVMLLGMTSFFRCTFKITNVPVIGVITSPVYHLRELIRNVGLSESFKHHDKLLIHYLNATVPKFLVKHWVKHFEIIIALSKWNKNRVVEKGVADDLVVVIPPSIDDIWFEQKSIQGFDATSQSKPYFQIVYYTAPLSLRGTKDLVFAFSKVTKEIDAKLKFVCRIDSDQSLKEINELKKLAIVEGTYDRMEFVAENLRINDLQEEICRADVVCLPFKIVISDVPISLLEAMASGIPVVSTNVGGIPDILGEGGLCAIANDPDDLSSALISVLNNNKIRSSMIEFSIKTMPHYPRWGEIGKNFKSIIMGNIGQ